MPAFTVSRAVSFLFVFGQTFFAVLYFYRVLTPKGTYGQTLRYMIRWTLPSTVVINILGYFDERYYVFLLLFDVIDIGMTVFLYKRRTKNRLRGVIAAYVGYLLLLAVGSLLSNTLASAFLPPERALLATFLTVCLQTALLLAASAAAARFLRHHPVGMRANMLTAMLIPQTAAIFLLCAMSYYDASFWRMALPIAAYAIVCLPSDAYIYFTVRAMTHNAELSRQIADEKRQQAAEDAHYREIGARLTALRRFRHDYANTLSTADALLEMGDGARLSALLAGAEATLSGTVFDAAEEGAPHDA